MLLSKKVLLSGLAAAVLAAPAFAEDRSTEKQKEQYLYQQGQEQGLGKPAGEGAIGATKPSSGPGVQGAPDTRTGPATRAPGDAAETGSDAGATTGASPGESGMDDGTQPSQDSTGVQGYPDTRTGPSTQEPKDSAQ
ncbi:hypothetical protein [Hyphomicrobium sp. CS1GBMeth3]|uniref:hypothetical protein n=1 Tax=Hyphomicrobium sp. CS1GBMeth3 TaxID=1892845 RepID=UPI0009312B18|nr:hypothetical protein [Hyphomicrobium sp. CS1GBMeth3]